MIPVASIHDPVRLLPPPLGSWKLLCHQAFLRPEVGLAYFFDALV
jgi:hypothetical protein